MRSRSFSSLTTGSRKLSELALAKAASRGMALRSSAALIGLAYLHIFKSADGPEIVCQVVV